MQYFHIIIKKIDLVTNSRSALFWKTDSRVQGGKALSLPHPPTLSPNAVKSKHMEKSIFRPP